MDLKGAQQSCIPSADRQVSAKEYMLKNSFIMSLFLAFIELLPIKS
jgi:hypothetical protein